MEAKTLKMDNPIPNFVGIPSTIVTATIGFINLFINGLDFTPGNILYCILTCFSVYYLYTKIQGQRLDNIKKKLRSGT